MRTAGAFVAPWVYFRLVEGWGEAAWTAPDLFEVELRREIERASLRFLVGLPP